MATPDVSRSELIRALVEVGALLTGPKPLAERMTGLCMTAAHVLGADQLTVLTIDNDRYLGRYQFGLPDRFAEEFSNYVVPRDLPLVTELEACGSYMLFDEASNEAVAGLLATAGMSTALIVPFTFTDGEPLGFMTVAYGSDKPPATSSEGELALGIVRLVQTTTLRELETQRRREVSQAMLQVADSERRRLSRDIHDDPLQQILGVRVGLEGFREQLDDPVHRRELSRFIEQCRTASASLREVMLRTHPNAAELADLEEVLQAMVNRSDLGDPLVLNFVDDRSAESPSYLVPALNRIAEQAARNTLRHASASTLTVTLRDEHDGTVLTIADDGCGFDLKAVDNARLGLVSMRERTELLGGTFTIASTPGQGTTISAWFPHNEL